MTLLPSKWFRQVSSCRAARPDLHNTIIWMLIWHCLAGLLARTLSICHTMFNSCSKIYQQRIIIHRTVIKIGRNSHVSLECISRSKRNSFVTSRIMIRSTFPAGCGYHHFMIKCKKIWSVVDFMVFHSRNMTCAQIWSITFSSHFCAQIWSIGQRVLHYTGAPKLSP